MKKHRVTNNSYSNINWFFWRMNKNTSKAKQDTYLFRLCDIDISSIDISRIKQLKQIISI